MGLVNFDRRAGRRLFETDHEAAALIEDSTFGVRDLGISRQELS